MFKTTIGSTIRGDPALMELGPSGAEGCQVRMRNGNRRSEAYPVRGEFACGCGWQKQAKPDVFYIKKHHCYK